MSCPKCAAKDKEIAELRMLLDAAMREPKIDRLQCYFCQKTFEAKDIEQTQDGDACARCHKLYVEDE